MAQPLLRPIPKPSAKRALYIRRVRIKNVRSFADIRFDLSSGSLPRMWGLVLGDNGVGKTTLLRCIAMGLCDAASAAGLLREIYGEWNRRLDEKVLQATITVEFFPETQGGKAPKIITHIEPRESGYSQIRQETVFPNRESGDFPWDRIFACGYGAGRRAFASKDIEDYATIDAVYGLFNYSNPLQNPELVIRRLSQTRAALGRLLTSIARVLMLPPNSIQLTPKGLLINGPWGKFHPIGALGDGYQATLAWLADLIGWALLYDENCDLSDVAGIVLVDELEQHLHPKWQAQIIGLLRQYLPCVQFLATTHTPMCVLGMTELSDKEGEILILDRQGDIVKIRQDIEPPRRQYADQVLTSSFFSLPTAGDPTLRSETKRLFDLRSQASLTPTERREAERLESRLGSDFAKANGTVRVGPTLAPSIKNALLKLENRKELLRSLKGDKK